MNKASADSIRKIPVHFILCTERTGSSLLSLMLNLNEEVICTSEELFALYFYDKYAGKKSWNEKELECFVDEFWLMSEQDLGINFTSKEKFLNVLLQYKETLDYELLVRLTYLSFLEPKNKEHVKVIVDKQIKYLFHLPDIIKIFPHAKFIILTRDVRDNVVAKLNRKMNQISKPFFLASVWYYTYKNISKLKASNKEFQILHYEDLVEQPETALKKVCDFIGVSYNEKMLKTKKVYEEFLESRKPFISEVSYHKYSKLNSELSAEINNEKIRIYKSKLNEEDENKINHLTKGLMDDLGYKTIQEKISNPGINEVLQKIQAWLYRPVLLYFYHQIPFSVKIMIKKLRK